MNTGVVILFEVSGVVGTTNSQTGYRVSNPYTTIAGQTAPSPGFLLKNCQLLVREHDVLVHHMRCRGSYLTVNGIVLSVGPSAGGGGHYDVQNVVIDHCSASWSGESNILVHNYEVASGGVCNNITVSNCIASEGITFQNADLTWNYGKGSQASNNTDNVSYIKNLFIHNTKRNPYIRAKGFVSVNNLSYNCGEERVHGIESNTHVSKFAWKGDVIKAGPYSTSTSNWIIAMKGLYNGGAGSQLYVEDNRCETGYLQSSSSDWARVTQNATDPVYKNVTGFKQLTAPLWPTGLVATVSSVVQANIIANVGARPADRDSVDSRIINDVISGTGNNNHIYSVPGWPILAENTTRLDIPSNPHVDSGNGYTNLEVWLHALAAEVEGTAYDPCLNVICPDVCVGANLWSQRCDPGTGDCILDQLIESNSVSCEFDPCEGVDCDNICYGADLWSQRCDPATGDCILYQLLESNSATCFYDPCDGVFCPTVCIGDDLWSQICDPDTGDCVLHQLLQPDSLNCTIPDQVPSDETTILNYILLGGLGIMGLGMLLLAKKK